jgi:hypothetical protein
MMNAILRRVLPLTVLAVVLGACETGRNPVEMSSVPNDPVLLISTSSGNTNHGRTVVRGDNGATGGEVSAVVGSGGGRLSIGKHILTIPRGAVGVPTRFTMKLPAGDSLMVSLSATVWDAATEAEVSVGHLGFLKPLTLRLEFDRASSLVDPKSVVMLYLRADGLSETVPSVVHPNEKWLDGTLNHFSRYAVGSN